MVSPENEWNVVVVAAWNPAIFTPQFIQTELLKLSEEATITVQIPLNAQGPLRISHEGVVVMPSSTNLVVGAEHRDTEGLKACVDIAVRAVRCLPRTPFVAAGVNLRFSWPQVLTELVKLGESPLDGVLSDSGETITGKNLSRTIVWRDGHINFNLTEADGRGYVMLNFHRTTGNPDDLCSWLALVPEMVEKTRAIGEALGVQLKEGDSDDE